MAAAVLKFPDRQQPGNSTTTPTDEDDGDYYPIERLKRQYNYYLTAKDNEIEEQREARRYYHGSQWTAKEIETLKARKQPVVTSNRIVRKIDAIVGLVERLRQDPKGFPRTPEHDEGAELATATIRYVLDSSDWKSKSARIARFGAIDGIAGIEYDLVPGDEGDPNLELHLAYGENYFYDPSSYDEGFTDVRYNGNAKWIDVDQAKELVPEKADQIEDLVDSGSDMTTSADADRERTWINTSERRVRMVDHWYIKGGKWRYCLYVSNTKLMEGISPFLDEKGKTFSRYRMFSANVDQDGDRYGFIRNLKGPQDEINHRRSKALFKLNARGIVAEKGAVDDVEVARREAAKADMFLEKNPGMELEFDDSAKYSDFKGQLELLQEAKNEIENFGPNPALIGQGLEDSSGRAISLLQQAGIAELGPYLSAFKNWKMRVYRDIWNIIQRHWTKERWIRVTDDQNVAQFFQINMRENDQYGRPQIVNAIGSLDVDIIIDEAPDAVNMQADNMMVLQSLGPQFAQEFPDIAIELSPLAQSVKKPALEKIKAKQNQPLPPDPKVMALQAKGQLDQQGQQFDQSMQARQQQIDERAAEQEQQRKDREAMSDMAIKRMEAMFEQGLKRMEAQSDIQIERIKAAASIQVERERHENQMTMDRERARQKTATSPAT